jgi:hypothetical protein
MCHEFMASVAKVLQFNGQEQRHLRLRDPFESWSSETSFTDNWTGEMDDFIPAIGATYWEIYKTEYLPLANPKVPEPKKKFTFRYSIYGTKATDEEDDPPGPDEFQKFIYPTPTTVAKNDTHWNPIN